MARVLHTTGCASIDALDQGGLGRGLGRVDRGRRSSLGVAGGGLRSSEGERAGEDEGGEEAHGCCVEWLRVYHEGGLTQILGI